MKINFDQLTKQLSKNLASIYLITGNEPLLIEEAKTAIREAAFQAGYTEREQFTVTAQFDWNQLLFHAQSLSLFSNLSLLEINLSNQKLGQTGSKALQAYLQQIPKDKILLITADKLETSVQKSAWFTQLEKIGIVVQIWSVESHQLPQWINQRAQQAGLQIDAQGIKILSAYCEGNLLAAKQTIEKLKLLIGGGQINSQIIMESIADNARFDVFKLTDTLLQGNSTQSLRILQTLQQQALEPIIILWAITRELRNLIQIIAALQQGRSIDQALQQQQIWSSRKALMQKAIQRHNKQRLENLLSQAKRIDEVIKGITPGNIWDELLNLCLRFCLNKNLKFGI